MKNNFNWFYRSRHLHNFHLKNDRQTYLPKKSTDIEQEEMENKGKTAKKIKE